MRFRVDPWSVEYGASVERDLVASEVEVHADIEISSGDWREIGPRPGVPQPGTVLFVDGVRRVDARVWIDDGTGDALPGICASYAAGVVVCGRDRRARVVQPRVGRGVFSAAATVAEIATRHGSYAPCAATGSDPEALWLALQERMGRREVEAAEAARDECPEAEDALVVVDGPLTGRQHVRGAIGVVKTHSKAYLEPALQRIVGSLRPGARTPLFMIGGRPWSRLSWYLRLPGAADAPWAGVVRVECSGEIPVDDAIVLADAVGPTLCRFASEPHKDPRAPQNLYPIAGLERDLRHRLGDPGLLFRALRVASVRNAA
jgi:hypothetical protein